VTCLTAGPGGRRDPRLGSALSVAFFAVWIGFIAPINRILAAWSASSLPADWSTYRDHWELWHGHLNAQARRLLRSGDRRAARVAAPGPPRLNLIDG
jgi:hypothetical protein